MRNLWLGPHLLNDEDGARAHREAKALGDEAHELLLATGDRLASSSAILAQHYYRNAATSWKRLGAEGFSTWVEQGERIIGSDPVSRDGANAFFSVSIEKMGEGSLASLIAWCDTAMQLAEVSNKLCGLFLQNTARLLEAQTPNTTLERWASAGASLHEQHGWQGEFLAQAFFNASANAIPALSPTAFQLWAGAGSSLFPKVREKEFFTNLSSTIAGWPPYDQANLLRIVIALAPIDPEAAYDVYRNLPKSVTGLAAATRATLLQLLAGGGNKLGTAVRDFVPIAGPLLRQVPSDALALGLAQVERNAKLCPESVIGALRSLPRVCEEAEPERVVEWFDRGLEVAKATPAAAIPYFALESRTSLNVLRSGSTAATLEQNQGLLRKYIHMMSGIPAGIRPMDRLSLRPDIEEFPHEREVTLPSRIDLLPSHEENLRLYRLLAAQLAGRRDHGTYEPDENLPEDPSDPPGRALFRYLSDDRRPPLTEDLFTLAEANRIHSSMRRVYRGIAAEADWAAETLLCAWADSPAPARTRRLDSVMLLSLIDGKTEPWPRWLDAQVGATILALLAPLKSPDATTWDSITAAEAIALALEQAATGLGKEIADADGSFYETAAGEMIYYDLYDEEESAPPVVGEESEQVEQPEPEEPGEYDFKLELSEEESGESGGVPISPEELQRLLESGANMSIRQGSADDVEGLGLYITDLMGKMPSDQLEELRQLLGDPEDKKRRPPRRWLDRRAEGASYWYDEWDYQIQDYRSRWCRLYEIGIDGDSGEFFHTALSDHADLLPEVRRQFQRIRPEMYRTVRGLEDGEDFDLNAAVAARIDARAGIAPSNRLYIAKKREERDVATLFLVDMSASTDEPLAGDGDAKKDRKPRRIIDVTKETLAIMSQALEEIGDAFAIYGFSGHGREQVEMYRVKSFAESLTPSVKARLGAIEPRRSTRMGTALRHSIDRMASVSARSKHLILLSDGFPQDFDYGQDRRSNLYGIRDTAVALREAEAAGVTPFCITVDKAGHDYLREMCDENRYMVIDDITSLPRELPKIYQRVVKS